MDVLPGVLDDLGDGRIVVLNSWSFSYFPVERRHEYVELLAEVGRLRPVAWLVMDIPGLVDSTAHVTPPTGSSEPDLLTGLIFDGAPNPQVEALAFVQSHGQSMSWLLSS